MATQIKFRLREPQKNVTPAKQNLTSIYMYVNFGYYETANNAKGKKYIPVVYPTNENILPYHWGKNKPINTRKIDLSNLATRLENLETLAKEAILELKNEKVELTPETVKDKLNDLTGRTIKPQILNLNEFINSFISRIESGAALNSKGNKYGYTTIRNIKGLKSQFDYFQKAQGRKYDYKDINLDFYNDFLKYFNEKNYSLNTVGKYIGWFKHVMNLAKEKGYHTNEQYNQKAFKKPSQKTYEIYLKESELKQLNKLKLTGTDEKVRDLFLVGCYTALRFSDYSKLKKSNIKELESGVKVIEVIQQKTGDKVLIPIRPELEAILKKYRYSLPKLTAKTLNKQIKLIGAQAKINELVEVKEKKEGLTISKDALKHDKICSHTARRTCITNMFLSGIKPIDIMKISGHKTEREFMKYIRLGLEETANELSKHSYFTGKPLKIAK